MTRRVLHILTQRPLLTGSGVTLDALVRQAAHSGWQQAVIVGVPAATPFPQVGELPTEHIHPLFFEQNALDFALPGMSDVMPYPSSRFSSLTATQLANYRQSWHEHIAHVISSFRPDLIHAHHLWLVSAMLKQIAPQVPVINHCHATGLRQLALCPHLAGEVLQGCARNEHFLALHQGHAAQLAETFSIAQDRITVAGAGYRQDLFFPDERVARDSYALLFVGKYSTAKGLPWLLDAVERLAERYPQVTLHVAGGGAGAEGRALQQRMEAMAPQVTLHGQLTQPALADLMRRCAICVLPSFYEGVPLVLVEALACGCQLVATELPGILNELVPRLGSAIELVPVPTMASIDAPAPGEGELFAAHLAAAIERALLRSASRHAAPDLETFTWRAVFDRVERCWLDLLDYHD